MMSSEVNCQSIPSSSQASYNPQTSQVRFIFTIISGEQKLTSFNPLLELIIGFFFKVTPIDLASHSSKGYSLLDDDSFLELLSFSEDPKHK